MPYPIEQSISTEPLEINRQFLPLRIPSYVYPEFLISIYSPRSDFRCCFTFGTYHESEVEIQKNEVRGTFDGSRGASDIGLRLVCLYFYECRDATAV